MVAKILSEPAEQIDEAALIFQQPARHDLALVIRYPQITRGHIIYSYDPKFGN